MKWHAFGVAGYVTLLAITIAGFIVVDSLGTRVVAPAPVAEMRAVTQSYGHGLPVMFHILFCLATVVLLGNVLGRICERIGQPPVVGEVIAGILLGPSFLGALSPELLEYLMPSTSADPGQKVSTSLKVIAHLGVVFYMFLVGLELDAARLRHRAHTTIAISHASIAIPFLLGSILALWVYPRYALSTVDFTSFALFCGISLSITAFPVLARILDDRKLQGTYLGDIALGCAAADDVTAWCLLAFVVGVAKADLTSAGGVVLGSLAFILLMVIIVRPALARFSDTAQGGTGKMSSRSMPLVFAAVLLSSLATESIGIHALFGAFLLGAIIPKSSRMGQDFARRVKDPVNMLLMPAFFAFTGMRTQIGTISGMEHWLWCLIIILVATLGKFGGSFAAAKATGESWRDAAALGALMNTRGLMELIVLNIGLDLGIITPQLFSIMVIMALVTTVLTGPALKYLIPPEVSCGPDVELKPDA